MTHVHYLITIYFPCEIQTGEVDYDAMMDSDDDQGQHDAYLERMKQEGAGRDSDALDDDSDSSGMGLYLCFYWS